MPDDTQYRALATGFQLHWYRIDRVLGQGSFGITYFAHDCNLDRPVAVKEYLPTDLAVRQRGAFVHPATKDLDEPYHAGLESFVSEARTLAKFEHPNIVRVLNVFVAHNTAYMVMSYEEGERLEEVFARRGTLEEAELMAILVPLLDGLEAVHRGGLIHRDIKPANIVIREDGSPVLLDFGSARQSIGEATHTLSRMFATGYAALEQYYRKADQQGPCTNIYNLGAMLYRGVAGIAPPDALQRSQELIQGGMDPFIPALQTGGSRYTEGFLRAIDYALSLNAVKRPQSIAAWRQELGVEAEPVREADTDRTEEVEILRVDPRDAPKRRRPTATAWRGIAATVVLASFGIGVWAWLNRDFEPAPPATALPEATEALPAAPEQPLPASTPALVPKPESQPLEPRGEQRDREAQISTLLAGAMEDLDAGRLTEPKEHNALEKYRAVLALEPEQADATQGLETIVEKLTQLAREAIARKDWPEAQARLEQAAAILPATPNLAAAREELDAGKRKSEELAEQSKRKEAEQRVAQLGAAARRAMSREQWSQARAYIDQAARVIPGSEEALRKELMSSQARARAAAEAARAKGEAQAGGPANPQRFLALARQAMDRGEWPKAQLYLDRAAAILPESEEVVLLQGELISRRAQAQHSAAVDSQPIAPPGPASAPAGHSTSVKIQRAASSLSAVRPGQTVEFLTEFLITLPPNTHNAYIEATWVLKRDGRKLGGEGVETGLAKAGVNSARNELTLPRYTRPGRYTVEHQVRAGDSHDVARSYFSVLSD